MRIFAVALAFAGCSSPDAQTREAPQPVSRPVPGEHVAPVSLEGMAPDGTPVPELALLADAFHRDAADLRDTAIFDHLRDRLVAIQATAQYRQGPTHEVLAPETIARASQTSVQLADRFERAARRLREPAIATGMSEAARGVDDALKASFGTLPSQIVDELVWLRDDLCKGKKTGDVCSSIDELGSAFDRANHVRDVPHGAVRTAAVALEHLTTEDHTRVVLARALGKGPGIGQRCGAENLCASGLACETPSGTCEMTCSQLAMDPCPGGLSCVTIAGLEGTVCRPLPAAIH